MIIYLLLRLKISDPQLSLSAALQMLEFHALHHIVFDYFNLNNLIKMLKRLYQTKKIFFGKYRLVRTGMDNSLIKMD